MRRIFRLRTLILIILAAGVASLVATIMNQKQRLEVMDALERRQYLGDKLGGRIPDDQIDKIAEAISEKLDANKPAAEVEAVAEAPEEAAAEVAEEASEQTEG